MWTYHYKDELYHHGVKGQRWGVRRYQNQDGSLTALGKKREAAKNGGDWRTKFANAKKARAKAKIEKAKAKAAAEKVKADEQAAKLKVQQDKERAQQAKKEAKLLKKKTRILNEGNIDDIREIRDHLTNQELQYALTRMDLNKKLADFDKEPEKPKKTAMQKIGDIAEGIGKVGNLASKGIDLWNTTAKIFNSLNETDVMPTLDGASKATKAAEKAQKAKEEARKRLVDHGTIDEIVKNMGKLTAAEIATVKKRFENQDDILKRLKGD